MRSTIRAVALAVVATVAAAGCSTSDAQRATESDGQPALGVVQGDPGNSVEHRTPADVDLAGKRIALIAFANNPFWDAVIQGGEAANRDLSAHGVTVDYITAGATMDVPTVENALNSAVGQGYDAIGVVSLADGACPAIGRAAASVPVATFIAEGNCSQESGSVFFRGQPAADAGAKAATAMAQATGCTGSVGIITGSFSVQQHEERRQGFVDAYAAACPDSPVVGTVENGDDAGTALSQANDFMTANPDLRGIYVTAGGPFGAAQAVQQRGRTGQVAVVAYDFVPQNVDLIRSGVMQAAIGQDPYGSSYDTAVDLFNMLAGQPGPAEYFQPVNVAVMTKDNVAEVLESQGDGVTESVLAVRALRKSFGGVAALAGVDLAFGPGEVHALLGENGAGKSTLVAACSGAIIPDDGEILLDGAPARFAGPHQAAQAGIAVVHQEPALAPSLTVLENLLLPELAHAGWHRSWRPRRRRAEVAAALREAGLDLDLDAKVADLSVSSRQLVEIAKALSLEPRVLFLDEPNSALSPAETTRLFDVVRRLCSSSAAVVLISHRISEVFEIADRATILRNGHSVWSGPIADTTPAEAIATISEGHQSVAGRGRAGVPTAAVRPPGRPADEPLLGCEGLARRGEFSDVSLEVRAGEIVGVSGLVGAGRTELARCLFGLARPDRGTIRVLGEPVRWRGPRDAIANGIAFVPEDRAEQGVFSGMSVRWNLRAAAAGLRRTGAGQPPTPEELADRLGIKAASLGDPISSLSGGNQQKAVIGRWLMARPRVLILDEPTRGIDVGAKDQIYGVVRGLAAEGMGVLLISSEVEEIGELATRVVVMRRGRIAAEVPEPTDVRSIMAASFGEEAA